MLPQERRDRRVLPSPIALQINNPTRREGSAHRVRRQNHTLIHQTRHAPRRRHIHKHRSAFGARPGQAFGGIALRRRARRVGRGLGDGGQGQNRDRRRHHRQTFPAPRRSAFRPLRQAEHPGGKADQNQRNPAGQNAGRAGLLRQHPDQPQAGGIHRKRQRLLQHVHPRARPGGVPSNGRIRGQQGIRRGQTQAHDQKDRDGDGGRGGEAGGDGRAHERGGARRGDQHREQAGKETARVARTAGKARSGRREASADLKDSGQVQPDGKQQNRHRGDENRRLELKPPADGGPGGAGQQQHRAQTGEGDENPGGIGNGMARARAGRRAARQTHRLHGQDREDAGHQVQDQPAEKGKQQGRRQGNRLLQRRRTRLGENGDIGLLAGTIADGHNAGQRGQRLWRDEAKRQAARRDR